MAAKLVNVRVSVEEREDASKGVQLLSFPAGVPMQLSCEDVQAAVRKHLKNSNKNRFQLGVSDCLFEGSCDLSPLSKFALGVFDDKSETLRLTEVAGIFEMRRVDSDSESDSDSEKASKKATERENRRMLVEEFGSRKKKRAMHSRDLARIDIDQSGSTGAINLALEAGIESKNKGIEAVSRNFLPQYNLEATEAKLIYPFGLMLPDEARNFIDTTKLLQLAKQPADRIQNKEVLGTFCSLCVPRLKKRSGDKAAQQELAVQVQFMKFLLGLAAVGKKILKNAKRLSAVINSPEFLSDFLLNRYREPRMKDSRRTYGESSASKTRLLCHICVLALHIFEQNLPRRPFDELAQVLKISSNELFHLFDQIGAVTKKSGSSNEQVVVSLRVPFKLPELQRGSKRSRG